MAFRTAIVTRPKPSQPDGDKETAESMVTQVLAFGMAFIAFRTARWHNPRSSQPGGDKEAAETMVTLGHGGSGIGDVSFEASQTGLARLVNRKPLCRD